MTRNDKKAIALIQALVASQKDEGDGQQGTESSAAVDEANQRALVAEAKAEAMMQGILPKYVDDAVALALPKVDDDNDLKSVLKDLKAKYPVWCEPDEVAATSAKEAPVRPLVLPVAITAKSKKVLVLAWPPAGNLESRSRAIGARSKETLC